MSSKVVSLCQLRKRLESPPAPETIEASPKAVEVIRRWQAALQAVLHAEDTFVSLNEYKGAMDELVQMLARARVGPLPR